MKKIITAIMAVLSVFSLTGCAGVKTVGTDVKIGDVTEFYYTLSTSTNPPVFQRYRFFTENGRYYFYHESRAGDHWPLTEEDITVNGTVELTEEQWNQFFDLLKNGTVEKRKENLDSGDSGPWLYLYWKKDKGDIQEFTFESLGKRAEFVEFCEKLRG